jgi:GTP-binding protein Era
MGIKSGINKSEGFRSGFVALIGRPNVGKSTLLNALLGEKVAIVSEKPQTTRNRMKGIKNAPDAQVVFIDTPGFHKMDGLLNAHMIKEAVSALDDVDAVVFMVDAASKPGGDETLIMETLRNSGARVILAINKIDRVEKGSLLPLIDGYSKLFGFADVVPISAAKGDGVAELFDAIKKLLPEGPKYFPDDILTDEMERVLAAEIVREKIFKLTKAEVPYSTAVVVEEFKEKPTLVAIKALIVVERDSQKGIIIGKGGAMLKKIGIAAREEIERLLHAKVYLELYVKVRKGWTKDKAALREFGYE